MGRLVPARQSFERISSPSKLEYILSTWRLNLDFLNRRNDYQRRDKSHMNIILWILQALLALLFLFAGGTKLLLPIEMLTAKGSPNQVQLPALLIRLIGGLEVLGALGLILPGIFRIKQNLTPLAAAGLVIIMIGATVLTVMGDGVRSAVLPFTTGVLCAFVAYGRSRTNGTVIKD